MKFIIVISVWLLTCINLYSQSKEETEQWLAYQLNEYCHSSLPYSYKFSASEDSGYEYLLQDFSFFEGRLVVNRREIKRTKFKDSIISHRIDTIQLSRLIKIDTAKSLMTNYKGAFGYRMVFKFDDFKSYPVIKYDLTNQSTDVSSYGYFLHIYKDEGLSKDMHKKIYKALIHLAILNGAKVIKDDLF